MSDDGVIASNNSSINKVENSNVNSTSANSGKVIDESSYKVMVPKEKGPTAVGQGGDSFYRKTSEDISKKELQDYLNDTAMLQDSIQKTSSNKVAESYLETNSFKDLFFQMKDGFVSGDKQYGRMVLMGYRTPSGVDIPRLKIYDENGEVLSIISGPMVERELNSRAMAFLSSQNNYEAIIDDSSMNDAEIYSEISDSTI